MNNTKDLSEWMFIDLLMIDSTIDTSEIEWAEWRSIRKKLGFLKRRKPYLNGYCREIISNKSYK